MTYFFHLISALHGYANTATSIKEVSDVRAMDWFMNMSIYSALRIHVSAFVPSSQIPVVSVGRSHWLHCPRGALVRLDDDSLWPCLLECSSVSHVGFLKDCALSLPLIIEYGLSTYNLGQGILLQTTILSGRNQSML
jgi:hypothetical protein